MCPAEQISILVVWSGPKMKGNIFNKNPDKTEKAFWRVNKGGNLFQIYLAYCVTIGEIQPNDMSQDPAPLTPY